MNSPWNQNRSEEVILIVIISLYCCQYLVTVPALDHVTYHVNALLEIFIFPMFDGSWRLLEPDVSGKVGYSRVVLNGGRRLLKRPPQS